MGGGGAGALTALRERLASLPPRWRLAAGAAAILLFPLVAGNRWVQVANYFWIYALLGLSLNVILGYAGLFQLGHAAFYAVGAYLTGVLGTRFDVPVLVLLPLSALAAGLCGIVLSRPILHLRGDYLCIVTIGFGEIARIAIRNLEFTGGPNGIYGIPRPGIPLGALAAGLREAPWIERLGLGWQGDTLVLRSQSAYYFFFLLFVLGAVFAMRRLEDSRVGRGWLYVREDELAAEALGVDTVRMKLTAFALGAAGAGVVGCLYASWVTVIAPESFGFWESVIMFCIVVLGGVGSIPGVFVGAAAMIVLPELLRSLLSSVLQWRVLVFGAAMILLMVFRPQGLWPSGRFRSLAPRRAPREPRTPEPETAGAAR
jgi:branched-chain amino acid transport system permease protein